MTNRARSLRRRSTAAERYFWNVLRDRRLEGLKFRQQAPLGRYVADFACLRHRLLVESDGPFHDPAADERRDAWLASQGFRVLRFPLQTSKEQIVTAILDATSPSPLVGEGGLRSRSDEGSH
jgi:very-short-patch-repair endonuclease